MSKVTFQAVINFEIEASEAVRILAAGDRRQQGVALSEWFADHYPTPETEEHYNLGVVKTALGSYLAEERVEEARQLTLPAETVDTVETP